MWETLDLGSLQGRDPPRRRYGGAHLDGHKKAHAINEALNRWRGRGKGIHQARESAYRDQQEVETGGFNRRAARRYPLST